MITMARKNIVGKVVPEPRKLVPEGKGILERREKKFGPVEALAMSKGTLPVQKKGRNLVPG